MAASTPCPYCGVIGFVRKEHVIKADSEHTQFYCGRCNKAWVFRHEQARASAPPKPADRPDHSRW